MIRSKRVDTVIPDEIGNSFPWDDRTFYLECYGEFSLQRGQSAKTDLIRWKIAGKKSPKKGTNLVIRNAAGYVRYVEFLCGQF